MKVAVTGSSGLIGSALIRSLSATGHGVVRLVRSPAPADKGVLYWDPASFRLDPAALEGLDAMVHLAGESIASGRWSATRKARIRDSRVVGTKFLSEALSRLARPPRVLATASAIGYYGNRGEQVLREDSAPGIDFLAEVCRAWEAAVGPAVARGIRVVHLRFGVVLSPEGGALAKMLLPFRLGLGGRLGSGQQYMSWVALDDAVGAIEHALATDTLRGPVNVVAPRPVTNLEFTRTLGRVLSRPTLLPVPAPAARLALGEMADALLLASSRVEPARLLASGYRFRHPDLEEALRQMLGRTRR
jgi:hypothetical protein